MAAPPQRSQSASAIEEAFARMREESMKSSYTVHHSFHKESDGASKPRLAPQTKPVSDHPLGHEEMQRLMQDAQRQLMTTTYMRSFPDYGDKAKPAVPKKMHAPFKARLAKDEKSKANREAARARDLEAARALEELKKTPGYHLNRDFGFSPTTSLEQPPATAPYKNVLGLPSIYWNSETRSRFNVEVHSRSANSRYGQPTPLSFVAKGQFESMPV
mmetsp:Transcript_5754/g.13542  ORF Transcript_5754/g.13542 Transcript_5754/m.13542 type:complete len:216 (+) Transcript_5754:42-689(+)|eukprot:CAMPEP_0171100436 /NCGR_PEP_ID=MMETSP0766_2-20121228/52961_1 /TAXON_ID=439317 /ORGANISM="Gambierdiscus australes, Strain CAWD 149" /LENGTH=215 /DNA_ID=CAMNT_0011560271 /DNA_START=34 /DNA_END=681 /DNA_ORIENTATION=+